MAVAYEPLLASVDGETWEKAEGWYEKCCGAKKYGADLLTREQWLASEVTKRVWREKHFNTVALWTALEDGAREAVRNPGSIVTVAGRISYLMHGGFLWCRLPSDRCLCYADPRVEPQVWIKLADGSRERMGAREAESLEDLGLGQIEGDAEGKVTALGVEGAGMRRFALYGGLATENCVQAVARDLMAQGMLNAERAGYPLILTIHDEAAAEAPLGFGTLAEFERLLCDMPAWAEGLPVTAEGWEGVRYRKE